MIFCVTYCATYCATSWYSTCATVLKQVEIRYAYAPAVAVLPLPTHRSAALFSDTWQHTHVQVVSFLLRGNVNEAVRTLQTEVCS